MTREQRITTPEQLDALPKWTIVQEKDQQIVSQKLEDGMWYSPGGEVGCIATDFGVGAPWNEEFHIIWMPPVHDPSLDISPDVMIGRKPNNGLG